MSTRVPREKAVFVEALEIADPKQRSQFLDQACGVDHALREQVERLLALSQSAGDFFQDCAPALELGPGDAGRVLSAAESALEPEMTESKGIGPYKLLQKLGEGSDGVLRSLPRNGMGFVRPPSLAQNRSKDRETVLT